jgi:dipeptidyl aminopeptidase/acylaminoacyl peptidase
MIKKSIAVVLVVAVITIGYIKISAENSGKAELDSSKQQQDSSPAIMPFHELTIPFLSQREYVSNLGELEEISQSASYTSYLTTYDSDGLKINGLLTIPKGEKPKNGWPALVFIHGYIPPSTYKTLEKYTSHVDYLASKGIVVFKIDLRGHGQSEGEASGAYYSSDYVVDVLNAHSALKNTSFINEDNISLWGHSMAGNVVLRSIAANHNIKKAIIWAGAVYTYEDFAEYGISDNSYRPPSDPNSEIRRRRQELFETHGSFNPNSSFWQQVVPTNYLQGYRGEVQLHHASDDPVASIDYSRNLASILDGLSVSNTFYEYPQGGHNITGNSFAQAMQKTVELILK